MADYANFRGKSGTQYTFVMYPKGLLWPVEHGVYILARRGNGLLATHKALYVGETESFRDRLNTRVADHDGYRRAVNHGMTHIGFFFERDPRRRLAIETDLRHGLHPICNLQSTGGMFR